ncbi:MAG: hypothetical protein EOP48_10360 [Sphingobacteriales bacterium]|nr:MAG: hypothetical protein EOP48_10360 [Sphingobacteriales bacterium]
MSDKLKKLTESNALLQSLIDEFKTDPVDDGNEVPDIIAAVKTLVESRNILQMEYNEQKANGEALQKQLNTTYNELQKCSKDDMTKLKTQLADLQKEFDAIVVQLNVTNELVVPLNNLVTKSHDDLRKCIEREKQFWSALPSKEKIAATAEQMVGKPVYKVEIPTTNNSVAVKANNFKTPTDMNEADGFDDDMDFYDVREAVDEDQVGSGFATPREAGAKRPTKKETAEAEASSEETTEG